MKKLTILLTLMTAFLIIQCSSQKTKNTPESNEKIEYLKEAFNQPILSKIKWNNTPIHHYHGKFSPDFIRQIAKEDKAILSELQNILDEKRFPLDPFADAIFKTKDLHGKEITGNNLNLWLSKKDDIILLWSIGPDQINQLAEIVKSTPSQEAIEALMYDPTNGMLSSGDFLIVHRYTVVK